MSTYLAPAALLPDGWATDVRLEVDDGGTLTHVAAGDTGEGASALAGPVLPGAANLHSHAFQRGLAGRAESAASPDDSFWTWREVMYRFVEGVGPEEQEALALQLYVEMLKAGYTAVGEFHYLHAQLDGTPYEDPAEMARRVLSASRRSGIGITLLPVLYTRGGFGDEPLEGAQRRFAPPGGDLLTLLEALLESEEDPQVRIGFAPHSLRAVPRDHLVAAVEAVRFLDPGMPIHVHAAEQQREVEACVADRDARPVEWILAETPASSGWCLIHATHVTPEEAEALARSAVVAGLCPTTEANLGDGIFPLADYLAAGGSFGIGSDSHVSVSPVEELRWLEYGQRLRRGERNVAARFRPDMTDHGTPSDTTDAAPAPPPHSTGELLYRAALDGGRAALGRAIGTLAPGCRADWVVLDPGHPSLAARDHETLLDGWIFSGNTTPVRDVMVGGSWVVEEGRHALEEEAREGFARTLRRLF